MRGEHKQHITMAGPNHRTYHQQATKVSWRAKPQSYTNEVVRGFHEESFALPPRWKPFARIRRALLDKRTAAPLIMPLGWRWPLHLEAEASMFPGTKMWPRLAAAEVMVRNMDTVLARHSASSCTGVRWSPSQKAWAASSRNDVSHEGSILQWRLAIQLVTFFQFSLLIGPLSASQAHLGYNSFTSSTLWSPWRWNPIRKILRKITVKVR